MLTVSVLPGTPTPVIVKLPDVNQLVKMTCARIPVLPVGAEMPVLVAIAVTVESRVTSPTAASTIIAVVAFAAVGVSGISIPLSSPALQTRSAFEPLEASHLALVATIAPICNARDIKDKCKLRFSFR